MAAAPPPAELAADPRQRAYWLGLGEVSEWFKVPLSKSGVVQATVGSNPTLSAPSGTRAERCRRGRHRLQSGPGAVA